MSAASIAPESRRLEEWEVELAEVRAMTEREMENLVTEDDTPVDNILSEKQQRLLTEPLYSTWVGPEGHAPEHRGFLALANVGLFYALRQPPLVPDMMLALDVPGLGPDLSQKGNRSYFVWVQDGKSPAVVVEIVSNQEGGEDGEKLRKYEAMGIPYYVIFDPWRLLSDRMLRIYQFAGASQGYIEQVGGLLDAVGLGLSLWQGEYEGTETLWLRWTDREGRLIPTGAEWARQERQRAEESARQADQERQQADQERQRADQERQRATEAEQRAERLAARLRELGIEPPA
jgi:Uma2 family endonuclease